MAGAPIQADTSTVAPDRPAPNRKEATMKTAIHSAIAIAFLVGSTAATAGEITGPPPTTNGNPAPGTTISNGNSLCSFSGLNDTPDGVPGLDPGGQVQSYGYFMAQFGIYDPSEEFGPTGRSSFLFPANGCNPTVQGGTHQ
jgi:hypothetical protein